MPRWQQSKACFRLLANCRTFDADHNGLVLKSWSGLCSIGNRRSGGQLHEAEATAREREWPR